MRNAMASPARIIEDYGHSPTTTPRVLAHRNDDDSSMDMTASADLVSRSLMADFDAVSPTSAPLFDTPSLDLTHCTARSVLCLANRFVSRCSRACRSGHSTSIEQSRVVAPQQPIQHERVDRRHRSRAHCYGNGRCV